MRTSGSGSGSVVVLKGWVSVAPGIYIYISLCTGKRSRRPPLPTCRRPSPSKSCGEIRGRGYGQRELWGGGGQIRYERLCVYVCVRERIYPRS